MAKSIIFILETRFIFIHIHPVSEVLPAVFNNFNTTRKVLLCTQV